MSEQQSNRSNVVITKKVVDILGWPTDTVEIDHISSQQKPRTLLLFCPGNPGLVGWYAPALQTIVQQLGPGFAARGISYAGHGVTDETVHVEVYEDDATTAQNRNVQIPWTVNGQVEHKSAWMDMIMSRDDNHQNVSFIFISHSIGAHLVQRLLVLRNDIRQRTTAMIHWMPYIRMDAPWPHQDKLTLAAQHVDSIVNVGKRVLSSYMNRERADRFFQNTVPDKEGREIAVNLVQHPTFVRNFFELGTEEIRDLPHVPDIPALRLLSSIPTFILYCSHDQWFPEQFATDLATTLFPNSIVVRYAPPPVKHDFIVYPNMVPKAVQFSVESIQGLYEPKSKL